MINAKQDYFHCTYVRLERLVVVFLLDRAATSHSFAFANQQGNRSGARVNGSS